MLKNDLLNLQKEKIYPSVTLLMPTTRITVDANKEKIQLKNLINELKEKLDQKVDKEVAELILEKTNQIINEIDLFRLSEGLGIFVNEKRAFYIKFPFPVPQMVVVDDTFETKFLIKQFNRSVEYFLINLNEKDTNLFKGFGEILEPVQSVDFPFTIEDVVDLKYDQGTWGYESAQLEKIRQYIRETYKRFKKNSEDNLPLIVSGVNKLISLFEELTDYKNLIGKIEGSYNSENLNELGKKANKVVEKFLTEQREKYLLEFKESFGFKKAAFGLLDIWNLANQGRVEVLLVEENYHQPVKFEGDQPFLITDTNDPYVIEDFVDEIIEVVFLQKGKVFFYEDGKLKDYQKIGAILRY
ncbi:MAG: hypothetical protein NUV92_03045 [Ignavibacteria bacterium]|jgi:hypothetical protein|nr:hypothetical protein [Ignavibacteria bacterium]MDH7527205.1 hypothetical protein [Ignavibacteria bacterium]